jgi:hypothetical protein
MMSYAWIPSSALSPFPHFLLHLSPTKKNSYFLPGLTFCRYTSSTSCVHHGFQNVQKSYDGYREPTQLVQHFGYRGKLHRRRGNARHILDMAWLYHSPVPVSIRPQSTHRVAMTTFSVLKMIKSSTSKMIILLPYNRVHTEWQWPLTLH